MRYLFDTDHATILQQRRGSEFDRLLERIKQHDPADFAFSVVSYHEQSPGCHGYINRARTSADLVRGYGMLSRVIAAFAEGPILPFDDAAAATFRDLSSHHRRVNTMDLRIAAIALSRNLTLLTRNVADFGGVPSLRTENWTA